MFPEGIELHCKKGVDETRLSTRQSKKNDLRPPDVLDQSTNEKKAADDISVLQRRTLATVFSYEYCQNTIIHTLVLYLVVDNNIVNYPCTIWWMISCTDFRFVFFRMRWRWAWISSNQVSSIKLRIEREARGQFVWAHRSLIWFIHLPYHRYERCIWSAAAFFL